MPVNCSLWRPWTSYDVSFSTGHLYCEINLPLNNEVKMKYEKYYNLPQNGGGRGGAQGLWVVVKDGGHSCQIANEA